MERLSREEALTIRGGEHPWDSDRILEEDRLEGDPWDVDGHPWDDIT